MGHSAITPIHDPAFKIEFFSQDFCNMVSCLVIYVYGPEDQHIEDYFGKTVLALLWPLARPA